MQKIFLFTMTAMLVCGVAMADTKELSIFKLNI